MTPSLGPGEPIFDRSDPRPLLFPTWEETFILTASCALTASEKYVTRPLNGPLRILDFTARSSTNTTTSLRLHLGLENDDDTAGTAAAKGNSVFGQGFGETTGDRNAFFPSNTSFTWPINRVVYDATARIVITATNTAGTAQDLFAAIRVQYLRDGQPDHFLPHD